MHIVRTTKTKQGVQHNSLMLSYTTNGKKLKIPAFDSNFSQSLQQQFLRNPNFWILGEGNLIFCCKGPTDPDFDKSK